jgi:NAD(P)H dehydrogenase (quinone)
MAWTFVDVPDAAARQSMIAMGMPPALADSMLEFTGMVRSGNAKMLSDTVQTITGKPPRTFVAWAKEHAAAFR